MLSQGPTGLTYVIKMYGDSRENKVMTNTQGVCLYTERRMSHN